MIVFTLLTFLIIECNCLIHPGGWLTSEDIHRIRSKLESKSEPWTQAKEALMKTGANFDYHAAPLEEISRDPANNTGNGRLQHEASEAYTLMIKWVATNDKRYTDAAIRIIDGWSATLKKIGGKDAILASGIYGNKLAQAAELAAYAEPNWPNKKRAQDMFRHIWYPVIQHGSSANWGTSAMAGIMSMGIFLDDQAMVNQAIEAYKHSFPHECAAVDQYIDETGETAESGRDQYHTQDGIAHLLETAVTAWNQKINLFTYNDSRLALGFEYVAKYNLGHDVSYHPFKESCTFHYIYPNGISTKGRGQFFPIWEMAHVYFTLAGIDAPYVKAARESHGYSPEGTNVDFPGFGTPNIYTLIIECFNHFSI